MNKLLSLIIVALLLVVGYLWFQKTETPSELPITAVQEEVIGDSVIGEKVEEEAEEEVVVSESTAPTEEPESVDFCTDLKAGIPGSSGFHITIDVASGETLGDESEIRGCVYSIDGSYGTWAPFEGQVATYTLEASDGTLLTQGLFETTDPDWLALALASADIPYETELAFDPLTYTNGTLTVNNENPSGEPGLSSSFTVSVTF